MAEGHLAWLAATVLSTVAASAARVLSCLRLLAARIMAGPDIFVAPACTSQFPRVTLVRSSAAASRDPGHNEHNRRQLGRNLHHGRNGIGRQRRVGRPESGGLNPTATNFVPPPLGVRLDDGGHGAQDVGRKGKADPWADQFE